LYKVYSTEVPEREERREKPLQAPKWRGCDRCEKFNRRKVWKFEDYACSGRGGYVWKEAQGASKEVRYDETAFSFGAQEVLSIIRSGEGYSTHPS